MALATPEGKSREGEEALKVLTDTSLLLRGTRIIHVLTRLQIWKGQQVRSNLTGVFYLLAKVREPGRSGARKRNTIKPPGRVRGSIC